VIEPSDRIVAVGLLSQRDLEVLGAGCWVQARLCGGGCVLL
jgi:hypothetical protein